MGPESAFTLDNRDQGRLGYFRQYKDGCNSLRGSADAAVLIVKDAQGVCGVGYKLRDASNYDDYMVSLTELSCALGLHLRPRARSQHGSRPRQVCRRNQEHPLLTG